MKEFKHSKTFRYGANATVLTALFIVIVIVLNIVVGMMVERFPSMKIDLSANSMFSISDQTKDALSKLSQDVDIFIVQTSDGESTMYNEILGRYKELSSHLDYSYINVTKDPSFLQKYAGQLNAAGSLVVESGERFEIVSGSAIYGATGRFETAEKTLTNAILAVTNKEKKAIYFTSGHGEGTYQTLMDIAEDKYVDSQSIDLKQELPEEATMMIIAGPRTDFTMGEIDAVDTFVKKGGSLQIYLDPSAPFLTNLYEYIKEWGVEVKNEVVDEGDENKIVQQYNGFIPTVAHKDFKTAISGNILCTPSIRMDILYSNTKGVTSEPVLTTTQKGTATPAGSDQKSEPNTFAISILTTRVLDDMSEVTMYLCGTPLNMTESYNTQYVGNGQLANTVMSRTLKNEDMVDIPDKTVEVQPVTMSFASVVAISVLVVLIAFGVLVLGIVIFLRRRRL